MAELQWRRPRPTPALPGSSGLRRLTGPFLDWEDWLTLGLCLGAVLSVSLSIESGGWSRDMPALSLMGVLALLAAMTLARSPLSALLAWPLAAVAGAAVIFWQTMVMVGPGSPGERLDAIYFRFQAWFQMAFSGGISNDPLLSNVMVIGLTWLGVFLFGWSIFRWHNPWLGLIPGGIALFLDMVFVGDSLPFAIFFYVLIGFLLVMRSNLTAHISRWRSEGVRYPPLISLSFLHYSVWAVLLLMVVAAIAPSGPFPTPKPMDALIQRFEGLGVHFVRLAGPLQAKTIVPAHHYTSVLPFQGSINLGERHLLTVTVDDTSPGGPILLRGAAYEEYVSGGWKAGPRQEVELPPGIEAQLREALAEGSLQGRLISLMVTVEAKSVVGTVLFSTGVPVSTDVAARIDVPAGSLSGVFVINGQRDDLYLRLPDAVVVRPQERLAEGESYRLVGLVQTTSSEELQTAGVVYPQWVRDLYLQLPDSLPQRVQELAGDVAGNEPTPYDRAKAIESYLRQFTVAYTIPDTPPGRDAVDYFLFESRQGYFNYHASAMVVMLRAVGVPARLAVGFIVDQPDLDSDLGAYAVLDQNAYAWPEVYFPGQGWIPFNPTPDRPAALISEPRSGDIVPLPGATNIEPFDPADFDDLFPFDFDAVPGGGGSLPQANPSGSGPGYTSWIVVAAVAFAAAVAGSVALGWQRSVSGLPYPQQLWDKTMRLASWAGRPPQPGQTPTEFAARLKGDLRDVPDIPALAAAYNRSRFGNREPSREEDERLSRLWPHLRAALLKKILGRAWRRR